MGLVHIQFLELSVISFWGYQDENLKMVSQQYYKGLVRLHGYAGWPGSTLVAKANRFGFASSIRVKDYLIKYHTWMLIHVYGKSEILILL